MEKARAAYSGSSLPYLAYVSQDQIYYQTYDGVNWSTPIFIIPEFNNALTLILIITASTLAILITKRTTKKIRRKYV